MSQESNDDIIRKLKPARILFPVLLGLAVVGWFISRELNISILRELKFTWNSVFWLFIAWSCMIGRDLGYIIRIKILSENDLTLRQAFRIIMLWEFTSAITPSTVGGTAVAVVFLNKEGISVGRSTAIVLATSFLDELYFVIMLPLIILIVGKDILFTMSQYGDGTGFLNNLMLLTVIGYALILAWVLLVGYGLFINPAGIKKTLSYLFKLPLLKRWEKSAEKAGNDIVESSIELRQQPFIFWIKAATATFLSWTSRYWVVNSIIMAFFTINEHFLIFARQLVTWIIMIILPTPGGSGFAELIMGRYISDTIPVEISHSAGIALAIAIIWRLISYYPYLIIGASIIPSWIQRKFIPSIVKKK
jgi:glycosyltransferase 2 family protein